MFTLAKLRQNGDLGLANSVKILANSVNFAFLFLQIRSKVPCNCLSMSCLVV